MEVRGILFDKDGTLIDCDLTWAPVIRHLAEEMGAPGAAAELTDAAGLDPASGRFRAGSVWGAGSTRDLVRLWWPDAGGDEARALAARIDAVCAEMGPRTSVPLADLKTMFAALEARGLAVGIATNDSIVSLSAFLHAQGLDRQVAHRYGYDSVDKPKPAPDMVHAFARATGLAAHQIAVVGDNRHDLEMARAAGAIAVAVLSGNGARADLAPLADAVIGGIGELGGWLDGFQPARESARHVL
jgi:phosphoglycolate phosphatase